MEKVFVKHTMDKDFREMTLDTAFMEALSLSEGCSCEIEKQENSLFQYLGKYPDFITNITDEYKLNVLKGWEYEVSGEDISSILSKINDNELKEWNVNPLARVTSILLYDDFAVIKRTDEDDISIAEASDDTSIYMSIIKGDISKDDIESEKETALIEFKDEIVYISNIDVCTSVISISLTNGEEIKVELLRDEDAVDDNDYDLTVLGRRVTYS